MTSILIIDDDTDFCAALANNLIKRGHETQTAHDGEQAVVTAEYFAPEWVVMDLKMPGVSGLTLIPKLLAIDPATRIVVLTGYAGISTAVEAIKLGAVHYLSKPVSTDDILAAFNKQEGNPDLPVDADHLALSAAERDHILRAFERNQRNLSATARELGMHRRTLQRKLGKLRLT